MLFFFTSTWFLLFLEGTFVLATLAFAGLAATYACVVAFTVSFKAVRFTAVASFFWESATSGSSLLDSLLSIQDEVLEAGSVFAVEAAAVLPALLPLGKALAVHLETEGFFACTADFSLLGGGGGGRLRRQSLGEGILLLWRGVGYIEVIEWGLVGDHIDGVDHFEALIVLGELIKWGKIEHGNLGVFIHIIIL